jgi:CheY-like chemotaxis protein/HAMP domain-containing protein/GAF domain-containing protein
VSALRNSALVWGIVLVGVIIVGALTFSRSITRPLRVAVAVADQVSEGDLDVEFVITSEDEIGQMLTSLQRMVNYILEAAVVAEKISNQDLQVEVTPKSKQDLLNQSLRKMVANLQTMIEKLNRSLTATEQQNWLKDGVNQLNNALMGEALLQETCQKAVSFVARFVEAGHGVLYTYNPDQHVLNLSGSFAFTEQDRLASQFRLGEGVIGQVAQDRQPILLKNLKRADRLINTGTVSEPPLNTYTFPLLYNDELYGVLELASFEPFDEAKQNFLTSANRVIATVLFSALQRERVQELLHQSQQAAQEAEDAVKEAQKAKEEAQEKALEVQQANARLEEQQQQLQQQSEELQQINAHLEEQQQQVQQQREELRQQNENLRLAKEELDYRTQELESAGRDKVELLSKMSHELRTPLNSIILVSKMLSKNEKNHFDDKNVKQLKVIQQAGEDLLRLLNTILDRRKGEAEKAESLETTRVPQPSVQTEAVPTTTVVIEDDRQSLVPADKVILIIEDHVDLAQSMLDIARSMGCKALIALNGHDGLALSAQCQPTGILLDLMLPDMNGMDALHELKQTKALRHIPVHIMSSQERDETFRSSGAIGYSQKPVDDVDIKKAIAQLIAIAEKYPKRVLIVEDDEAHRDAIRDLIGDNQEIQTTGVGSKHEAIAEITKGIYDAAILDLGLKDGSGYEICKYIKEHDIQLPVIIYTGKDLSEDEERELRTYTDSIIIKTARSYERLLDEVSICLHTTYRETEQTPSVPVPSEGRGIDNVPESATAIPAIDLTGKKILIADDDVKNVFVLASALEKHGATVIDAKNGEDALVKLRQEQGIGLVLMDVMMPGMDGYTTMRQIRQDQKLKHLPIIALTAKALQEDRQQCIQAGANDYLSKPIDYDALIRLVGAWVMK